MLAATILLASAAQTPPPEPFGACPTPAQVAWHELEFYGFLHFTTNTFTDREWGNGDESPEVFHPTALDCRQWARIARDCGMKGLILTAKHHDGFCLWPSAFTAHSVKGSRWKDGRGDVLRDAAAACREAGLGFGVYLSPWDRNHAEYGRPAYVAYYRSQWKEIIESYGPLFEAWFDGANGGDGYYGGARERRTIDGATYYGWPETHQLILDLNPDAILFSDAGPGCRWVGNERGTSDETSWQTINLEGMYPGCAHDHLALGDKGGTHWVGVEVDVSIRPGWFYHASEDAKVKTPDELVEIYYESVGRGANLLLNVPPDRRGLIHENDADALERMRRILDETFRMDLARATHAAASSTRGGAPDEARYGARNLTDGDGATYWAAADGVTSAELTLDLGRKTTFDVVKLREFIPLGQRVEEFVVEVEAAEGSAAEAPSWMEVCRGTTVGPRRILRFEPATAQRVRIRITRALACPVLSEVSLYKRP